MMNEKEALVFCTVFFTFAFQCIIYLIVMFTCFKRNSLKRHALTQTDPMDNTIQMIVIHPNDDIDLLN